MQYINARSTCKMIKMGKVSYIRHLLVLSLIASTIGTETTGNVLVTCAACQTAQVKFNSWDCEVNCDFISSENGMFFAVTFTTLSQMNILVLLTTSY